MEVFVSHATADRSLAARFAGLLHEGLGLAGSDVFLSSRSGDIPNGKYFTEHILTTLSRADLVVALLSRVYMTRPFCQNEAGAALVGQINGDKELRAFVLPPFRFDEMAGALVGVQSGSIVDASDLDVFRTSILPRLTSAPHESAWRVHRDAFLHEAVLEVAQLRAEDYLSRIEIRDVHIERSAAAHIKFKSKLRVVLLNGSEVPISVGPAMWVTTPDGIQCTHETAHFQVEGSNGWQNNDWSDEKDSVIVPPFRTFRFWVGLPDVLTDVEVRRRNISKKLGKIRVQLAAEGHKFKPRDIPL